MNRVGSAVLLILALTLVPSDADAQQFVLRDDTAGWGWLALTPPMRAVVQLVYGSPQSGDQGRLDLRVLEQLRAMGVRRVWEATEFEPSENQVVAECAAVGYTPAGSEDEIYSLHTEVSYWDHSRLSATEIYESVLVSQIAPTDLASDTYVDGCVTQLARVLVQLGFDEG
jgi:hypothetical protein